MGGFNLVSLTVDHYGMAIATVAQRMSLGISSAFAIWYYSESYTSYKLLGILIALSAVVFINVPAKNIQKGTSSKQQSNWYIFFPVSICLISAIIEIALQYLHAVHKILPAVESVVLFGSAATVGLLFLSGKVLFFNEKLKLRNLVAGILLGVPNYFSIYFILLALNSLDGSTVYSLSNILVVTAAALTGLLVYKEQLSKVNVLGVAFAVLAIFLIVL
jgi:multidrug transporter EmrE-like cation transporter